MLRAIMHNLAFENSLPALDPWHNGSIVTVDYSTVKTKYTSCSFIELNSQNVRLTRYIHLC
jgi:hypothetical protein